MSSELGQKDEVMLNDGDQNTQNDDVVFDLKLELAGLEINAPNKILHILRR